METLPEECQFLTPGEDEKEERDVEIVRLLLETLFLVTARGGTEGRDVVRGNGGYVVVRECHLRWEDERVRSSCERIVDVLMVGDKEEAEAEADAAKGGFRTKTGSEGKNIRGSGLPQASGGRMVMDASTPTKDAGAVEAREAAAEADEDEDNAIVPIF